MVECDLPKVEIAGASPVSRSMVTNGMFWKRFYFVVILLSCNCFLLCSSGSCKWLNKIFGRDQTNHNDDEIVDNPNDNNQVMYNNYINNNKNDLINEEDDNFGNKGENSNDDNDSFTDATRILKFVFFSATTSVGKTSILNYLQKGEFIENCSPTYDPGCFVVNLANIGVQMRIQLWDSSGDPKNMQGILDNKLLFNQASAIVFVYDITNKDSFDSLEEYIKKVREKATEGYPFFLLGNKLDLTSDGQRQVTTDEAIKLATEKHLIFLGECSAKNNTYEPAQDLYCKQKDLIGEDGKCIEGLRGMLKDIIWSVHKNQNPSTF